VYIYTSNVLMYCTKGLSELNIFLIGKEIQRERQKRREQGPRWQVSATWYNN